MSEAFEVVKNLNDEIENFKEHEWFPIELSYSSDGYNECITFLDTMIWNNIDDMRSIDDETGDYEDLDVFVRTRILKAIRIVSSIKIKNRREDENN